MCAFYKKKKEVIYRDKVLLAVFLSIFPWPSPQPDLNEVGTVSIEGKEVICKE